MSQTAKVIPFAPRPKHIQPPATETETDTKTVLVNQITLDAIIAAHSVMNALMASLMETSEVQP